MKIVIHGDPITKKNSQRIIRAGNRPMLIPSAQYKAYEADAIRQILRKHRQRIDSPCNVQCVYYMRTRRKVDLVNLMEATCDILVRAEVLEDDNSRIVAMHDGSRVAYDKDAPRVEIEILPIVDVG
nr:MAG TPA: Endodeoxyribonuclease RusA [Caudoviricetes sp.]